IANRLRNLFSINDFGRHRSSLTMCSTAAHCRIFLARVLAALAERAISRHLNLLAEKYVDAAFPAWV
ncbi:hypothetical protein ACLKQF_11670, partial [Aeromonas salmonicida]